MTAASTATQLAPDPTAAFALSPLHQRIGALLDQQIFFIVGCQKSGTTWVQRLLDGHPQICCRGEAAFGPVFVPVLQQLMKLYNEQQHYRNDQLGAVGPENLMQQELLEYLFAVATAMMMSRWSSDARIRCWGEKTPEHALFLPLLQKIFPKVKVIHIIRDPRDVAVSGWFHNLRFSGEKFRQRFATISAYVEYLIPNHWVRYIREAQAFGRSHPDQYFELRYEQLHARPDDQLRSMLRFLDVDADGSAVQTCCDAGAFNKLAAGRASGQENRASFFRKGVVGDWQEHLDAQTLQVFARLAQPLMRELGYE